MTNITRTEHEIPASTYTTLEVQLADGSTLIAQRMEDSSIFVSNPTSMLNLNITTTDSPVLRDLLEAAEQEWPTTPAEEAAA